MPHPSPMHLRFFWSSQAGAAHAISKRPRRQKTCHFALPLKGLCGKIRTGKNEKTQHRTNPIQVRANASARLQKSSQTALCKSIARPPDRRPKAAPGSSCCLPAAPVAPVGSRRLRGLFRVAPISYQRFPKAARDAHGGSQRFPMAPARHLPMFGRGNPRFLATAENFWLFARAPSNPPQARAAPMDLAGPRAGCH